MLEVCSVLLWTSSLLCFAQLPGGLLCAGVIQAGQAVHVVRLVVGGLVGRRQTKILFLNHDDFQYPGLGSLQNKLGMGCHLGRRRNESSRCLKSKQCRHAVAAHTCWLSLARADAASDSVISVVHALATFYCRRTKSCTTTSSPHDLKIMMVELQGNARFLPANPQPNPAKPERETPRLHSYELFSLHPKHLSDTL